MNYLENRARKRLIKSVNSNLKSIVKLSKLMAKKWDVNTIPLILAKEIIDEHKPKFVGTKETDRFIESMHVVYEEMFKTLANISKSMNSKNIAVSEIEDLISITFEHFRNKIMTKRHESN